MPYVSDGKESNMQVSRETAERLQKAGWVKPTHLIYRQDGNDGKWYPTLASAWWKAERPAEWLPNPDLSEILEELSYEDFAKYYRSHCYSTLNINQTDFLRPFSEWLYTTMRDVEKAAEVWLKMYGKKSQQCELCKAIVSAKTDICPNCGGFCLL